MCKPNVLWSWLSGGLPMSIPDVLPLFGIQTRLGLLTSEGFSNAGSQSKALLLQSFQRRIQDLAPSLRE